jgi:alpha-L-glutamate ligase-like protein
MPIKPSHILGMNGRYRYTKLNPSSARAFGFSKLKTKQLLLENNIPTAQLYHMFESYTDLDHVIWENIPCPFVLKPASGSAGKGIRIITKYLPQRSIWQDNENEEVTVEDLNLHVQNILDGEYSTWGSSHRALVEEMIIAHPVLKKLSKGGTPDIRIIVFNSVPIMAMARIPTEESGGKANLDIGAIGLGIDMSSGLTTFGIQGKSKYIKRFPQQKRKVSGIQIPFWRETLLMAVSAAQAAGFIFMGADLFIDETKGPMVVELNGFPGLSIQLANKAGLKRRIERVEGIEVRNADHGVRIAQALFAKFYVDQQRVEQGLTIISNKPTIVVKGDRTKDLAVPALVNTLRARSAISRKLAVDLGLLDYDDLLWQQQEVSEGKVPVVEVEFEVKDQLVKTAMLAVQRLDKSKYKVELGQHDIKQFLIGDIET